MERLLVLLFIIASVASDNVTEDLIDLCSDSSSYESYTKNTTQNCGCRNSNSCIRKCCQEGFYLEHYENPYENVYHSVCIKNDSLGPFNVPVYNKHVFNLTSNSTFLVGMLNCRNEFWQYFKMDNSDVKERYYIQGNGNLYFPYSKHKYYNNSRYCVDEQDGLTAFLCFSEVSVQSVPRIIYSIGMIISMPFLLLTFLVFAVVSNASVHRRVVMFYSLSLFIAYGFLVTVQLNTKGFNSFACQTVGYSIIFFFTSSFFWMNALCFDIWFAFGFKSRHPVCITLWHSFSGLSKFNREPKSEKRRFSFYCLYAWGLPIIHVLIVLLINTYGDPNSKFYPGVGRYKCFLEENLPSFIYFYGPMTVVIGINIILFLLTSIKISKIKKDTVSFHRWTNKRKSYAYDKRKFHLYLKLLLAMGVNWSLEILSWVVEVTQKDGQSNALFIWYISDFCNAIYGLIIFLIFVYRKTIWNSFKKRVLTLLYRIFPCCNKSYEVKEFERSDQEIRSRTTSVTGDLPF